MQTIEAIYEDGVLRPLEPVALQEHQRVRLVLTLALPPATAEERLAVMRRLSAKREELRELIGTLPDSTEIIREDRMRDH